MHDLLTDYLGALPTIWAIDTARYLIAAGSMTAILWLFRRAGLSNREIQSRTATGADVRREIVASLRTAAIFALVGTGIYVAASRGWITVHDGFAVAGPAYLVVSLAGMIVAHDAWFYWTHRLMHHRSLFPVFHRTHHLSRTPTPWAAYAFDVPEALVNAAFVPLFLAFVPMHGLALFVFVAFQIVRNVMGHAGVELHPRGMVGSRWFGWNNTTTHHDLHHETGAHDFGLYFTWWDRLMGTEHPEYRRRFEAATTRTDVDAGKVPA